MIIKNVRRGAHIFYAVYYFVSKSMISLERFMNFVIASGASGWLLIIARS